MSNLPQLFAFVKLLHTFRNVERSVLAPKTGRLENDSEHSYQLAMLAWYLMDKHSLDLNKELVLKYALAHDLVEAYAGDTYIYTEDQEHLESKREREEKAAERIQAEFPEHEELHALIRAYESRPDKESKFVYALDKIEPLITICADGDRSNKKFNVDLQMIIDSKEEKVKASPIVKKYFKEIVAELKKTDGSLFE